MWYLLVAAGAGYLAQRWQHTHKSRPLLPGKCENQRSSPPTSAPASPKRSSFSLSAVNDPDAVQNANTSPNGSGDEGSTSVDCKASLSCFVSRIAEDNIPYQQVSKLPAGSPRGNSQVVKSNKRSACEAFLVPVPDAFKPPIQGNTKEQIASNPRPSLDFGNVKENTQDQFASNSRPSLEFANILRSTIDPLVFTSKPSSTKDPLVFMSKPSLGSANIQGNVEGQEQLQGDSTSPSSCCSSSSTVLNSPIGRKPIQQKIGSFQFQGKEQRQEINVCEQPSVAGSPSLVENNTLKGRGQGVVSGASKCDFSNVNYTEALQHTSPWGCEGGLSNSMFVGSRSNTNAVTSFNAPVFTDDNGMLDVSTCRPYVFTGENQRGITRTPVFTDDNGMLDASTHRPYVFTGENQRGITRAPVLTNDNGVLDTSTHRPYVFTGKAQRGITRTDLFSHEYMCNDKVELEMKQVTLSPASDMNCPSKVRSLVSPSHSVATEIACDAESESLVSFGLAMAVFCMVSSSKREMEKMGKVLKETEDLVSDMRKELEERRAQSYVSSRTVSEDECNEKPLTIKSKDAVTQVFPIEKANSHIDTVCQVGLSDDESIRSALTEEHTQYDLHVCDLKAGHEDKLQFVEGYWENGNQNEEACDSEDENDLSTLEETGEDDYVLSMLELERKLWKIFQQRQEEKISELEESLETTLSKLHAKEEELQWWKNRVSWLMEHAYGSTSGAILIKDQVERVEGFNHTDESRFSINGCDSGAMSTHKFSGDDRSTRKFSGDDKNMCEFSAGETRFLALEEECIEFVGNEGGPKNSSGHQNQIIRVGSACSISSEESVLSFDERTFTYPEYMGSIQHS